MNDAFKIFVEQLKDGHTEEIEESFDPSFIDVDPELTFKDPIEVSGEAYIAEDTLVLRIEVDTKAILPCLICGEPVTVDIKIPSLYHVEPLSNIKTGIFNFQDVLREEVILEAPHFAECNDGNCPKRKGLDKFIKKPNPNGEGNQGGEGYHPFANL